MLMTRIDAPNVMAKPMASSKPKMELRLRLLDSGFAQLAVVVMDYIGVSEKAAGLTRSPARLEMGLSITSEATLTLGMPFFRP